MTNLYVQPDQYLFRYVLEKGNLLTYHKLNSEYQVNEVEDVNVIKQMANNTFELLMNSLNEDTMNLSGEIDIDFSGNDDDYSPRNNLFLSYSKDDNFKLFPNHSFNKIIKNENIELLNWNTFTNQIISEPNNILTSKGFWPERINKFYDEIEYAVEFKDDTSFKIESNKILSFNHLLIEMENQDLIDRKPTSSFFDDVSKLIEYNFYIDCDKKMSFVGCYQYKYMFFTKRPVILVRPSYKEFLTNQIEHENHLLIANNYDQVFDYIEKLKTDNELYQELTENAFNFAMENFTQSGISNHIRNILIETL